MKVLNADSWLKENEGKYPNGCNVNRVMDSYAVYFHKETLKYEHLMGQWKSEWHSKYRLLDIDFEAFCKMMKYPPNDHDKYLRGNNNPGSL